MKRLHVALAVRDFASSVADYTVRLGAEPCCTVEGKYALWRTDHVNLSMSVDPEAKGKLRHLGFEDSSAASLAEETDANGIVWERFASEHQNEEIIKLWPDAKFRPLPAR